VGSALHDRSRSAGQTALAFCPYSLDPLQRGFGVEPKRLDVLVLFSNLAYDSATSALASSSQGAAAVASG
jgi:hypothetical protein